MGFRKNGTPGGFLIAGLSDIFPAHLRVVLTICHQLEHQKRHQAALGVVHVVPVAQPLLGLAADQSILALGIASRNELVPAIVVAEVLNNQTGFRNDNRLGDAGTLDRDDWGFSKGVDFSEFFGREHVLAALVGLDLVRYIELLEEPEDALRARLFEPVNVSQPW